jgi:hypothetical protein
MHQSPRISLLVLAAAVTGLAAAMACGCGGSLPAPAGSPLATTSPHPATTPSPPVSTTAPLLDLGGSASYVLPDGGVVTVIADEFDDSATAQDGTAVGAGERLVSLNLVVRAEEPDGASAETVTLSFKKGSFLLIAADDSLYAPANVPTDLSAGRWKSASSTGFDLPFVVPDSAELVRFVCTPGGGVTPRSATWLLK